MSNAQQRFPASYLPHDQRRFGQAGRPNAAPFRRSVRRGMAAIEYCLLASLIAVVCIAGVQRVGNQTNGVFSKLVDAMNPAASGTTSGQTGGSSKATSGSGQADPSASTSGAQGGKRKGRKQKDGQKKGKKKKGRDSKRGNGKRR